MSARGPVSVARDGSVSIPIYQSTTRTGTIYRVAWYEGSQRKRRAFAQKQAAEAFANRKASEVSSHGATSLTVSNDALLALQRAINLLRPLGVEIDTAVSEYVEARKILGDVALLTAAREYATLRPSAVSSPRVEAVVAEFMASKRGAGRSHRHVKDLDNRLGKFAKAFNGSISLVRVPMVETWLQSLHVGGRSRNNYLTAIGNLVRFCERRGYLARGWLDLGAIERTQDSGEVAIFRPDELRHILAACRPEMIPFVALGAFAGLRHAEIARLDWSEVGEDFIDVKAHKAKTRQRRLVPILPTLAKWLKPHRQESGPVCPYASSWNQVRKLARKAGVRWKPNGLRHSFGSYRLALTHNEGQVALEMGNTPAIIFAHYRATVTEQAAREWFAIAPSVTGIPATAPIS